MAWTVSNLKVGEGLELSPGPTPRIAFQIVLTNTSDLE